MGIKSILKKFIDHCKKLWGWMTRCRQKITLLLNKSMGWILFGLAVITILGIAIVVTRYFLYTPITITGNNVTIDGVSFAMDSINCIKAWNFWQPFLFRTDIPKDIACLPELKFWKRLSDPYEPLNIRNVFLGFIGITGIILASWRAWVAERETGIEEGRRLEEIEDRKVSEDRRLEEIKDRKVSEDRRLEEIKDRKVSEDRRLEERRQFEILEERRVEERKEAAMMEERRLDERFADAVKSLSQELDKTSYPAHLGAITSLRDLALGNINYTQKCLDILCSCNQWMEGFLGEFLCNEGITCFADRPLTDSNRIVSTNNSGNQIQLEHERRSQKVLQAIATIIDATNKQDDKVYGIQNIDLSRKMLCGINLYEYQIAGINLKNAYLNGANLSQIKAAGAKLDNANLQGALLYEAQLQGASLISANLKKADLEDADLREANLTEANLQKAQCAETIFEKAKLVKANLKGAYLRENVLSYADLTGANLYETDLTEAYIYGTNFHNANIQKATLIGADITESNLTGANMTESNLQGISIEKTKCQRTIFNQAKMHAVDFIDCDLRGSIFISSELQSASFNESNLEKCTLLGCNLYGVEIKNNKLQNIIFDAISDTGHIKTKGTRNTWIKGIGKGLIDSTNDEERISRIQQAWNKTDKGEMPKGLNALQQASILEKDATGRWVIMPSKIEELKEFYRALITESDKGFFIPISDSMDIISKDHGPLSKDYPEIQKTLKAILVELKKELKNKG